MNPYVVAGISLIVIVLACCAVCVVTDRTRVAKWVASLTVVVIGAVLASLARWELLHRPPPCTHVVVARYQEDLRWLEPVTQWATRVFIYDKGGGEVREEDRDLYARPNVTRVVLPNVGRKAHTYLHHIVAHYDALARSPQAVVVFLQGNIRDHIRTSPGRWVRRIARQASRSPTGASDSVPHPAGWPAMVLREYGGLTLHQQTKECLGEWQARVLGPRAPCTHQPLRWWPNALFAVQARNVGRTPRAAYVAMLRSLVACATCSAPVAGHYLERSWVYIVNATPGCSDAT